MYNSGNLIKKEQIMKLKDKEAWLELYDVAKKIRELEPWKYSWDMDFI